MTLPDLSQTTRISLVWGSTRVLVLLAAALGSLDSLSGSDPWARYVDLWTQWDTQWFASIAASGYGNPDLDAFNGVQDDYSYNGAFFPALPLLMRVGGMAGLSPTAAGLIISLAASLIAAIALGRLTAEVGGAPVWGVAAWLVAPTAVFLTAAYTEAIFCAFAFWAWVMARRGAWVWAGILAGGAALVRSNGLFLAVALIALFLIARPRAWRKAWSLLLPFLATGAYFFYQYRLTGRPTAWFDIQRVRWDRQLTDPVSALVNTWDQVFTFTGTGAVSSRFIAEIVAMAILLAFLAVILVRRWWPEAVYVGVTALSMGTSTWYYSVPRTLVVLFPIWMVLGIWLTRSRWARWGYVLVCLPLLVLVTVRFTQSQWIS